VERGYRQKVKLAAIELAKKCKWLVAYMLSDPVTQQDERNKKRLLYCVRKRST
jgi:hypothetical protein